MGKENRKVFKQTIHKAYRVQGQQETNMCKGNMGVFWYYSCNFSVSFKLFPQKVKEKTTTPLNDPENLKWLM